MGRFWKGLLVGIIGGLAAKQYAETPEGKKMVKKAKTKAKAAAKKAKQRVEEEVKKRS